METASAVAVAEDLGMRPVSLLFAFDNPHRGAPLALTGADQDAARAEGERAMVAVLFGLVAASEYEGRRDRAGRPAWRSETIVVGRMFVLSPDGGRGTVRLRSLCNPSDAAAPGARFDPSHVATDLEREFR